MWYVLFVRFDSCSFFREENDLHLSAITFPIVTEITDQKSNRKADENGTSNWLDRSPTENGTRTKSESRTERPISADTCGAMTSDSGPRARNEFEPFLLISALRSSRGWGTSLENRRKNASAANQVENSIVMNINNADLRASGRPLTADELPKRNT